MKNMYVPTPALILVHPMYLDIYLKSFRNSFRKFKIQVLFIKSDIVPFKVLPTATHLCQRLIQLSKHFWNSIVGIAIRAVFDFSITFFRLLKYVLRNCFLIRSNRKKSQGVISGEFDDCWMVFVSFLVKNSWIMMTLCDGALS